MREVNWKEDNWFTEFCTDDLTDGFKEWWVDYYGIPADYTSKYNEPEDYWIRCAFALAGWKAAGGR